MKHIMLIACASLLAPAAADAGNWSLEFSFGSPAYKRLATASYQVCRETWVSARYETVRQPVVIPARTARRYVPAVYEWRYDHHGHRRRVCVQRAGFRTVVVRPARTVYRTERVLVRGHYEYTCKAGCRKHGAYRKHRDHRVHGVDRGHRGHRRQEIRRRDHRRGRHGEHGYGIHVRYER